MKIRIIFGFQGESHDFTWFRDIMDFPQLVKYKGMIYEWQMHSADPSGQVDRILNFGRAYGYSSVTGDIPNFEEYCKYILDKKKCECGASHTSFPQFHMQFCPEYDKKQENKRPPDDEW